MRPALTSLSLLSASDEFCGDWKVNWFHLQDQSGSWMGHMQDMTAQYEKLAESISTRFPGSTMGSAGYSDKTVWHEDFVLISELTDKDTAVSQMLKAYPATWHPELPAGLSPWPEDDSSTPDSQYDPGSAKLRDEPEGCFEPMVWAALHTKWDDGDGIFRLITIAIAGLGHFDGDGSMEEGNTKSFAAFDRETYPDAEPRLWPTATKPAKVGTNSKYASLSLIKDVLREQKIHLVVLYGVDGNEETPVKGWKKLLTDIGLDPANSLFYMPMNLNIEESVLAGLKKGTCDPDHSIPDDDMTPECCDICSQL